MSDPIRYVGRPFALRFGRKYRHPDHKAWTAEANRHSNTLVVKYGSTGGTISLGDIPNGGDFWRVGGPGTQIPLLPITLAWVHQKPFARWLEWTPGSHGFQFLDPDAKTPSRGFQLIAPSASSAQSSSLLYQFQRSKTSRPEPLLSPKWPTDLPNWPPAEPKPAGLGDQATGQALLDDLNGLTGLQNVKTVVTEQVQFLRAQQKRAQLGLKAAPVIAHMLFEGNPGTGKTTVARIVANLYAQIGVLSKGQLVETSRADLIGQYVGHTAVKTQEAVERAKGGVLFIDEAYSLTGDVFAAEAVNTLLKLMEDHRSEFLVIAAGYPDKMGQFLGQNPGLPSRFSIRVNFDDYTDIEMVTILTEIARKSDYDVTPELLTRFEELLGEIPRGPEFANARLARIAFERAARRQALRLAGVDSPTKRQLRTLEAADLPVHL